MMGTLVRDEGKIEDDKVGDSSEEEDTGEEGWIEDKGGEEDWEKGESGEEDTGEEGWIEDKDWEDSEEDGWEEGESWEEEGWIEDKDWDEGVGWEGEFGADCWLEDKEWDEGEGWGVEDKLNSFWMDGAGSLDKREDESGEEREVEEGIELIELSLGKDELEGDEREEGELIVSWGEGFGEDSDCDCDCEREKEEEEGRGLRVVSLLDIPSTNLYIAISGSRGLICTSYAGSSNNNILIVIWNMKQWS